MSDHLKIAVLIVAAGSGSRAGAGVPKQYRALAGKPVIARCLQSITTALPTARIWVVISDDHHPLFHAATDGYSLAGIVAGGSTRQASVRHGLIAMKADPPDLVLVHDAARPFISPDVIQGLILAFDDQTIQAAAPGLEVVDTLKSIDGSGAATNGPSRKGLWRVQTPQAFRYPHILDAHMNTADSPDISDDLSVSQMQGGKSRIVPGHEAGFKITTSQDLEKAEQTVLNALGDIRIGSGFDVHGFHEGDHVMLCGVRIPHTHALEGHSDADVALHALTDAILGSIGAGDIGHHFPPSDAQWKGRSSDHFLRHAMALVAGRGGAVSNADVTIICEAPRVGPHSSTMTENVANILGISQDRVNIKATTTERLGFTGRREGIAAMATVSVRLPVL